jgi:hypothetical protein
LKASFATTGYIGCSDRKETPVVQLDYNNVNSTLTLFIPSICGHIKSLALQVVRHVPMGQPAAT